MSRYTAINKATGRLIAWGFDRPLSEYFLTEFWTSEESNKIEKMHSEAEEANMDTDGLPNPEVRFSIMSHTTTSPHPDTPEQLDYANSEIWEMMDKYPEIPDDHKTALQLDMPY